MEKPKSSAWSFFIEKRAVSIVMLFIIIILGFFSYKTLPREIQPEINIPFVGVTVALPGASPQDTETLLTDPLEKEISSISKIKTLSSSSGFSFTTIFIEFEADADIDEAVDEVKTAVDRVKPELPEDATEPIIQKAEANTFPVITFSVAGNISREHLTKIAEEIETELEKLKDIASVLVLGGLEKQIEIQVDKEKAQFFNITLDQIANAIKFGNQNVPLGITDVENLNYSLRVDNKFKSIDEIRNLQPINEVAEVFEVTPKENVLSKISINGEKSKTAVSLQVYKKDNTNIVAVADAAKAKIAEIKETLDPNVDIIVTNDNSFFVKEELGNLTNNGVQTAILIVIILFLSLGLTQGIIAGLTIPLTFLMTFPVLDYLDMSFNTLSLFSLVMSLGITIDTTVVIMEGIYENLKKGHTVKDSAILSVQTYKWPLIAGTLTNIFAFFPMLLVSGILGEFLRTMPITIAATLITSLFISLTIAPAIATKFIRKKEKKEEYHSILERFFQSVGRTFQRSITTILSSRLARFSVVMLSIAAFILSCLLPITGLLKVEMFPKTDQTYFTVSVEAPTGLILKETKKITEEIENKLYEIPEIDNFVTQIGTNQGLGLTKNSNFIVTELTNSNLATITVNLTEKDLREKPSFEIAAEIREEFEQYNKAKITVEELQEGPPSEDPITIRLTGTDIETLQEISQEVEDIVKNVSGTTNVRSSLKEGLNEFVFVLDQEKLAYFNLSAAQVSANLRRNIQGIDVDTIKINGEDKDIFVKYDQSISFAEIENFEIQTPKGFTVSFSELGEYKLAKSFQAIEHENEKRIIKITSAVEKNATVADINKKIEDEVAKINLPPNYEIKFGGDLEAINESFQELFQSMIVGIILITFTMILMFNSFKQPLIILFSLPLALIGVFPGLYLIGLNLSFPAFLGVVSLGGIVVNNAIVLIDRINENRTNGIPLKEAISEATNSRIEPIFITSLATIIGVIPLSFSNAFWAGLGFTIAFGQLFSTILVLFVIPVLYYIFEIRQERKRLAENRNL